MKKYHFFVLFLVFWIFVWSTYSGLNNLSIDKKIKSLEPFYNKNALIAWEVDYLYKKEEKYNSYIVKLLSINNNKDIGSKFLLKVWTNVKLNEKEIISFTSKIDKIDNFSNKFDYVKFMQSKWVFFEVNFPQVEINWDFDKSNIVDKIVTNVRQKILNEINSLYPKNEWAFLAWILQ
jgi:hypothetical protein